MSVSLVKITPDTVVYVTGYACGPYSPDPDHLVVSATIDQAREALADELDRASDAMFDQELSTAQDEYADQADYSAHYEEAHEASTSIAGSAGYVRGDSNVAWQIQQFGQWITGEPDGYSYWVHRTTLGAAFGDDTTSDEYLDVVEALQSV